MWAPKTDQLFTYLKTDFSILVQIEFVDHCLPVTQETGGISHLSLWLENPKHGWHPQQSSDKKEV